MLIPIRLALSTVSDRRSLPEFDVICLAGQHKLSVFTFVCCGKVLQVHIHVQLLNKLHSEAALNSPLDMP